MTTGPTGTHMRLLASATSAVLLLAGSLVVAVPAVAGGTSYTWVGSSQNANADNHSWTDARNWSPAGVPGDGDSVTITEPDATHCTAHVDAVPTVSVALLSIAATRCGTILSGGRLTVTGTFAWDGGTLATPTTIVAGANGTLTGANGHPNVLSADLDVAGTLTLTGLVDSGATNQGGFRIDNPDVLHVQPGGTLVSSGSNAVQFLSCCNAPARIVNQGTMQVDSGDLTVRAVAIDQDGALVTSAGGRLVSVGAPLTAGDGARYSGPGRWLIEDGSKATLAGAQTLGTGFHLELGGLTVDAGAQLGGAATLTGPGELDWTGGMVEGNLTIAHGTTLRLSGVHTGNGKRVFYGQDGLSGGVAATLTNHGTITADQGATVLTGYQAKLVNASDGTLSLAPGTSLDTLGCCVNPNRIVNSGHLVVPGGSSALPVTFDGVAYQSLGGTTSIAHGRSLALQLAPSTLSGGAVSGGGTLTVAAPTAVSGTITIGSGTHLGLKSGGSLDGSAAITGTGAMSWTGGSVSGSLVVAPSGGLSVSGPDLKSVANVGGGSTASRLSIRSRTTIGSGTSAKHDRVDLGRSSLTLTGSTAVGNFVDLANGTLTNTGSLSVQPGRGGVVAAPTRLVNRGTVIVRSGTLAAYGSYEQLAGVTDLASGTRLSLLYRTRSIALVGGVLEGSGTVTGGISNSGGTVAPGGSGRVGTLRITGAYSQGTHGRLGVDVAAHSRDGLAVSGAVSLRGTVAARDLGRFVPHLSAKYRIVSGHGVGTSHLRVSTSAHKARGRHWVAVRRSTALYLVWHRA